jgi:hypothetical protein
VEHLLVASGSDDLMVWCHFQVVKLGRKELQFSKLKKQCTEGTTILKAEETVHRRLTNRWRLDQSAEGNGCRYGKRSIPEFRGTSYAKFSLLFCL